MLRSARLVSVVGVLTSFAVLSAAQSTPSEKQGKPDMGKEHASPDLHVAGKSCPEILLTSDLIGMKVVSTQNEDLGKIDDVVVYPGGDAAYAVLSFGGVLGVGDKLFAIPWSNFRCNAGTDVAKNDPMSGDAEVVRRDGDRTVVLNVEKERLKGAPGFDKKNWPIRANAGWTKEVDDYYARRDGVEGNRPVEASAARTVPATAWRVSELKGINVETPTGEKLGDIEQLAIDTNGRVNYAVVSVGGFLGIGERRVAIPWEALKFTRDAEKDKGVKNDKPAITLATTKAQLEKAPEFKTGKDHLREMTDPKWVGSVYDYYSVTPYWNS
jgi:sporulation protein YlmC with PRC-barrel domain